VGRESARRVDRSARFERFKRIKAHELTVMTRQLATMVASGMSILRSFHVLEDQTENEKLKEILARL